MFSEYEIQLMNTKPKFLTEEEKKLRTKCKKRENYLNNKEENNEYSKKYYREHKEENKEYYKIYREGHKEQKKEYYKTPEGYKVKKK